MAVNLVDLNARIAVFKRAEKYINLHKDVFVGTELENSFNTLKVQWQNDFDPLKSHELVQVIKNNLDNVGSDLTLKAELKAFSSQCNFLYSNEEIFKALVHAMNDGTQKKKELKSENRTYTDSVKKEPNKSFIEVKNTGERKNSFTNSSQKQAGGENKKHADLEQAKFYYIENNENKGPLSKDQLIQLGLKPDTLIWKDGYKNWIPLHEAKELQVLKNKKRSTMQIVGGIITAVLVLAIVGITVLFFGDKWGEATEGTLIPVKSADDWGFVNQNGIYVINPQFKNADFFYNGLAKVISSDGKTGYIDEDGKFIIPTEFKDGTKFNNGLAFVTSEGGFPICIDTKGVTKFELKEVDFVYAFSEGLALFNDKNGKYGFVDETGKIVINSQFEYASSFFSNFSLIKQNGKYGFIDKTGKITVNPQFEFALPFNEGKAAFSNGEKWGYINTKGSYVINPQFDDAFSFSEGFALVKKDNAYGFIDGKGEFVINPQFEQALPFSNGLAVIQQNKSFGYIDKKGIIKINPQFEYAFSFSNDIAPVVSINKWGFIDKKGIFLINPQFNKVSIKINNSLNSKLLSENDFVKNDYYDASEFVELFFKKGIGNTFDGIDNSTTLLNLSDHTIYGDCLNDQNQFIAVCMKNFKVTQDIDIENVTFHFDMPIFQEIANFNSRGLRTEMQKKYDFSVKPTIIEYSFSLSGEANSKGIVISNSMKNEIENRYKMQMEGGDFERQAVMYWLLQDEGKLNFAIFADEWSLKFIISFNKMLLQNILVNID